MKEDFRKNRDMYWRNNSMGYNTNVNPKVHLAMIILLAIVLIVVIASALMGSRSKQSAIGFQMKNTEHFTLVFTGKDKEYIDGFYGDMEKYYEKLTTDLKILKPLKIVVKIYPDRASFREALGNADRPDSSTAVTVAPAEIWMLSLDSEDTGITREEAMGNAAAQLAYSLVASTAQKIPKEWLLNTFIVYETGGIKEAELKSVLKDSRYHSLQDFNTIGTKEAAYSAYTVGEHIVSKWGVDGLAELINTGGDLRLVLGKSEAELEREWQEYVQTRYK